MKPKKKFLYLDRFEIHEAETKKRLKYFTILWWFLLLTNMGIIIYLFNK